MLDCTRASLIVSVPEEDNSELIVVGGDTAPRNEQLTLTSVHRWQDGLVRSQRSFSSRQRVQVSISLLLAICPA